MNRPDVCDGTTALVAVPYRGGVWPSWSESLLASLDCLLLRGGQIATADVRLFSPSCSPFLFSARAPPYTTIIPFAMSTTRIFTALLAVGAALAKPIAKAEAEADALAAAANIDLGPGIPTASGLTITSLSYFGDGCPDGSLTGEFCPETSSFNVSIKDLKAILRKSCLLRN